MADRLIYRFTVEANMSTYVSGDIIEVLLDDTDNTISVEKNGSPITSGDDFTYDDWVGGFFTFEDAEYRYCLGGNLIWYGNNSLEGSSIFPSVQWKVDFPYWQQNIVTDSIVCTSNVGDLKKYGSPVITSASDNTTADATVAVVVTCSVDVKFNTQSFTYSQGGTAGTQSGSQYSHTFTGLKAGLHTLYASSSNGDRIRWNVDIPVDQGYTEKYYFDFTDRHDDTYRIKLKFRDYSGSSSEINAMSSSPLQINSGFSRAGGNKFKDLITGTKITINLKSETDEEWVSDFSDVDEQEVLCEIYKDPSGDNDLLYRGFNLVNQFAEPYTQAPYNVKVAFTDGLADLKNYKYTLDRNVANPYDSGQLGFESTNITGRSSLLDVISFCLRKTEIGNSIRGFLSYFPEGSSPALTDDPLKMAYINNDMFYTDQGEPDDCFTVLLKCLKSVPERARLSGGAGYWWIEPVELKRTMDYREFDEFGTYSTTGSFNPLIDFIQKSDVEASTAGSVVRVGGTSSRDKVYQRIQIEKKARITDNLLPEWNDRTKTNQVDSVFEGWTTSNQSQTVSWEAIQLDQRRKWGVLFKGIDGQGFVNSDNDVITPDSWIATKIPITWKSADKFELRFKVFYNPIKAIDDLGLISSFSTLPGFWVPIRWILKVGSYYYSHQGEWSTTVTINEYFLENFNVEEEIIIRDNFRTGQAATDENIEFYVYDTDVDFFHFFAFSAGFTGGGLLTDVESDIIDTVKAISTTGLGTGNRIIVAAYDTTNSQRYRYYYRLIQTGVSITNSIEQIEATDNSDFKWTLQQQIPIKSTEHDTTFYVTEPKFNTLPDGKTIPELDTAEKKIKDGNRRIEVFDLPIFGLDTRITNGEQLFKNIFFDSSGDPITKWAKYQQVDYLNGAGNYFTTSGLSLGSASSANVKIGYKTSDTQAIILSDATDGETNAIMIEDGSASTDIGDQTSLNIDGASFSGTTRDNLHTSIADGSYHDLEFAFDFSGFNGQVAFNRYQPSNAWEGQVYFSYIWLDLDNDGIYEYKWDGQGRALGNYSDLVRTGTPSISWQTSDTAKSIEEHQLDIISRHYKTPKRVLNFEGIANDVLQPFKGMQDENDSDRIYIFDRFNLNVNTQKYSGQITEISQSTETNVGEFSDDFSDSFNN